MVYSYNISSGDEDSQRERPGPSHSPQRGSCGGRGFTAQTSQSSSSSSGANSSSHLPPSSSTLLFKKTTLHEQKKSSTLPGSASSPLKKNHYESDSDTADDLEMSTKQQLKRNSRPQKPVQRIRARVSRGLENDTNESPKAQLKRKRKRNDVVEEPVRRTRARVSYCELSESERESGLESDTNESSNATDTLKVIKELNSAKQKNDLLSLYAKIQEKKEIKNKIIEKNLSKMEEFIVLELEVKINNGKISPTEMLIYCEILHNYGLTCENEGFIDEAKKCYKKSGNQGYGISHYNRALLIGQSTNNNEKLKAAKLFKKAAEARFEPVHLGWYQRAVILMEQDGADYKKVISSFLNYLGVENKTVKGFLAWVKNITTESLIADQENNQIAAMMELGHLLGEGSWGEYPERYQDARKVYQKTYDLVGSKEGILRRFQSYIEEDQNKELSITREKMHAFKLKVDAFFKGKLHTLSEEEKTVYDQVMNLYKDLATVSLSDEDEPNDPMVE